MLRATGHARMVAPMLWSPFSFAREARAAEGRRRPPKAAEGRRRPPKAARASRAQEKGDHNMGAAHGTLVLNRSPIIFKNLQINSKSVKEGMNRRIFSC